MSLDKSSLCMQTVMLLLLACESGYGQADDDDDDEDGKKLRFTLVYRLNDLSSQSLRVD